MKRKADAVASIEEAIEEAIDEFVREHPTLVHMCESIHADEGCVKVVLREATGNQADPWRQHVSTWRLGNNESLLSHVRRVLRSIHDKHLGAFCREKMEKCMDTISGDEQILLKYYDLLPEDADTLLTLGALGLFRAATVLDLRRTGLDEDVQKRVAFAIQQTDAGYWASLRELRLDDPLRAFTRRRTANGWSYG